MATLLDGERFLEGKEAGRAHEDNPEFMARSRQVHLDLAQRYGWTAVPANGPLEEVAERLWQVVESIFIGSG
jgi:thymidylate kinase